MNIATTVAHQDSDSNHQAATELPSPTVHDSATTDVTNLTDTIRFGEEDTTPEGTMPVLENNAHLSLSGQFSQELITLQHGFNKAC